MFGSLKYFLFFDILILIISYTIFLRSLIIFMIILNSFSGNSHTSFLQDQFLKIYFVPLLDHASSSALLFCTDIHTSEKTVTSPSLYRLALYRESSSPINVTKDSEGISNRFCGCVFSGLTCVNSQSEIFCWFLFSGVCNLLLPLVSVYCTAVHRDGPCCKLLRSFFVEVSRHLNMQGAVCAESGKAETSPLGSPPKSRMLDICSNAFPPQGETGRWVFSHSFHTKSRAGAMTSTCALVQTTAFVLSGSPTWCPFLSVFRCRKDGSQPFG